MCVCREEVCVCVCVCMCVCMYVYVSVSMRIVRFVCDGTWSGAREVSVDTTHYSAGLTSIHMYTYVWAKGT